MMKMLTFLISRLDITLYDDLDLVFSLLLLLILRSFIFLLLLDISDLHFDMSCSDQLLCTDITHISFAKTRFLAGERLAARSGLIVANHIKS